MKGNKYSIVLPVRNGGEYLKQCVASILAQTFRNFNLHILENHSTDGSAEWLRSLRDERIILNPSDRPLTIEENWARIKEMDKNEYLTMLGHDDLLLPNYLETMDGLINDHPDARLYQTHFTYIDAKGNTIRRCKPMDAVQRSHEFIGHYLCNLIDTMGTGFMMRSADYDAIGGIPPRYPNLLFADFELWIRLTQLSYKATDFRTCFSYRLHQSTTTTSSDIKFTKAFELFVHFLLECKKGAVLDREAIERYGLGYVDFYAKSLSHRLLRSDRKKRQGLTVSAYIDSCRQYGRQLVSYSDYEPLNQFGVRIAQKIDNNLVLSNLFLLFKKIYNKPIL